MLTIKKATERRNKITQMIMDLTKDMKQTKQYNNDVKFIRR